MHGVAAADVEEPPSSPEVDSDDVGDIAFADDSLEDDEDCSSDFVDHESTAMTTEYRDSYQDPALL